MMGYKIFDYAHQTMGFLYTLIGYIGGIYEKSNQKKQSNGRKSG